jgi:hypothetical protein
MLHSQKQETLNFLQRVSNCYEIEKGKYKKKG